MNLNQAIGYGLFFEVKDKQKTGVLGAILTVGALGAITRRISRESAKKAADEYNLRLRRSQEQRRRPEQVERSNPEDNIEQLKKHFKENPIEVKNPESTGLQKAVDTLYDR